MYLYNLELVQFIRLVITHFVFRLSCCRISSCTSCLVTWINIDFHELNFDSIGQTRRKDRYPNYEQYQLTHPFKKGDRVMGFNANISAISWRSILLLSKPEYLCNQCLSTLMLWVRLPLRAMCTTFCDKVCQRLVIGRWFSPGIPVSSTNKTDRQI